MSTRIKSAVVAIVIAIVALILHKTFVFNIFIGFIATVAVYEIYRASGLDKHKHQALAGYIFTALDSLMPAFFVRGKLFFFNYSCYFGLFVLAMCLLYLKEHEQLKYTDFFAMLAVPTLISYAFYSLVDMANYSITHNCKTGAFLVVITLCGAWLADSGAYFAGTFFGKTKLCPEISPKKTVEGLVGGAVCNGIFMIIVCFVYDVILKGASVRYVWVFVAGILCCLLGLVGDLTASIIKRQTGIKDYGNIMPGHGGVMDRFDSVLLVAPFMHYLISQGLILK